MCAVHTLQALVRGSGLGAAMLQYASDVAVLSLTLLRSPCWAMMNAALHLYSKTRPHHRKPPPTPPRFMWTGACVVGGR